MADMLGGISTKASAGIKPYALGSAGQSNAASSTKKPWALDVAQEGAQKSNPYAPTDAKPSEISNNAAASSDRGSSRIASVAPSPLVGKSLSANLAEGKSGNPYAPAVGQANSKPNAAAEMKPGDYAPRQTEPGTLGTGQGVGFSNSSNPEAGAMKIALKAYGKSTTRTVPSQIWQ